MKTLRNLPRLFARSVREFLEDGCTHAAAAVSYYALLSFFPLLLALLSILGWLAWALNWEDVEGTVVTAMVDIVPGAEDWLPGAIAEVVDARGPVTLLAFGGLVWSASAVFGAVRRALNIAWDVDASRHFIHQKALDVTMVLSVGLLFLVSTTLSAALRTIRELSLRVDWLPPSEAAVFWEGIGSALPLALTFASVILIYRYVPNCEVRWKDIWLGALVATVGFEVAKNAFLYYLAHMAQYNLIYGSLSFIISPLILAYVFTLVLLFGAEVASEYPRVQEQPEREGRGRSLSAILLATGALAAVQVAQGVTRARRGVRRLLS